ncbi:MAG TPA: long-chain fatty acid--CoA ligase [Smithella sp.]|nr:long-chain fatty acid--CoA ligase [Smithella sp.]
MESRFWIKNYDYSVPETIRYPRIPLYEFVNLAAAFYPRKAATDFYGSLITFGDMRGRILRLANALIREGIKKGDRIGIALPNCPQYVMAYYAVLYAGGIVVNMNPLYTHDELEFMIKNTGMEYLFTFDMVMPTMGALARESKIKLIVTRVTDFIDGFGVSAAKDLGLDANCLHFSELLDSCREESIPDVPVDSEDAAVIQFTGGTTGLPKGAVLTHANIIAAAMHVCLWGSSTVMAYIPPERGSIIAIIPYFHVYGNTTCLNAGFFTAATQVMLPRFEMSELLGAIARYEQISFFPAVPTLITAIVNHPQIHELNLASKLALFNSGGAPMPTELIKTVRNLGIFFSEGWGMSETAAMGIANPVMRGKAGSIGVPLPDNDIRLVDLENGEKDVPLGEPGEILMKGPTVMKEYWNNPEETARQLKDGWLATGDIGQMDKDGYVTIVDRKKDMIIAGGFNIYPREVDEVLYRHPKVAEGVAVGIPDAYRGETVKVFVVLKEGMQATADEIIAFCKEKLAPYKVPKFVEFRDSLPKSAVGKILRKILRDEEIQKQKA